MNLYVHVPFCKKKCNYCAFYSVCPTEIDWDGYILGILSQLESFDAKNKTFDTVFFGGGTPSLMPVKYAEKIIKNLKLSNNYEWTIEANPKTISSLELKDWKDLGLNRLSIGIQSFYDEKLKFLGRIHTVKDSLDLLDAANNLGLRVSGDFIYAMPNETVNDVVKMCEQINKIGLKHASLYELTIEKGTKFQNLVSIDEYIGAKMYHAIGKTLKLKRYEVSNYGDPCRHNQNIWAGEGYIGVGESAAGRVKCDGINWIETKIVENKIVSNKLTNNDRFVEIVLTGLRTDRGVSLDVAKNVVDLEYIRNNPKYFLINNESIKMTDHGLIMLDYLMPYAIK